MDDLRLPDVAARVVAWHNRHPLARRITAAQVRSIGYVALPFRVPGAAAEATLDTGAAIGPAAQVEAVAEPAPAAASESESESEAEPAPAPAASLRARAAALAQDTRGKAVALPPAPGPGPALTVASCVAAFSEEFIAPWPPRRVACWALQHGRVLAAEPADGPIRRVSAVEAPAADDGTRVTVWVNTAAIECEGRRVRLLLGAGATPAVLGRRVWSRARLGSTLGVTLLLAATAVWQWVPGAPDVPTLAASAPPAHAAASAPLHLPPAHATVPPPDVEPRAGRVAMPALRPALDDATRAAARREVAALRAARSSATPARFVANDDGPPEAAGPAATPPPTAGSAAPATMAPAAAPARAALFGLSTRLLRTRAESEQMQAALQALLASTGSTRLRVEMLPVGEDWRVVCWPFERRDDAERARASLLARGIRLDTVDF